MKLIFWTMLLLGVVSCVAMATDSRVTMPSVMAVNGVKLGMEPDDVRDLCGNPDEVYHSGSLVPEGWRYTGKLQLTTCFLQPTVSGNLKSLCFPRTLALEKHTLQVFCVTGTELQKNGNTILQTGDEKGFVLEALGTPIWTQESNDSCVMGYGGLNIGLVSGRVDSVVFGGYDTSQSR